MATTRARATTSEVVAGDCIFIPSGVNAGIYTIGEVVNATTVKISDSPGFVAFPVGVSFRVVKVFGVTVKGLKDLFGVLQALETYISSITSWVPGHVHGC